MTNHDPSLSELSVHLTPGDEELILRAFRRGIEARRSRGEVTMPTDEERDNWHPAEDLI